MTLSTLKTMNVQMEDLRESLNARPPMPGDSQDSKQAVPEGGKTKSQEPAATMVDPVQWWGALTKQFTQLAASAMQEPTGTPVGEPAKTPAPPDLAKPSTGTPSRKRGSPKR